jgi:hypothetical protein
MLEGENVFIIKLTAGSLAEITDCLHNSKVNTVPTMIIIIIILNREESF